MNDQRRDKSTLWRRSVSSILAVVLLSPALTSQDGGVKVGDERAAAVVAEGAPLQDEVEALKALDGDLITLSGRVAELWADENNRLPIRQLVLDPESSPTLATAIGRELSKKKIREAIPDFLHLQASSDFEQRELDERYDYVLMAFHSTESIFGELDAAVAGQKNGKPAMQRLLDVYVEIVSRTRDRKRVAFDRHDAVDRLTQLGPQLVGEGPALVLETLSRLCEGAVSFPDLVTWRRWFDATVGEEAEHSLTMADVYRSLWQEGRKELKVLRDQRRALAREIISRMRNAAEPEPPVSYLTDTDAEVRRTALLAIQAMAAELPSDQRSLAVAALITQLEVAGPETRRDIHPDLVEAAGALGRDAAMADRKALVAVLFARDIPRDAPGMTTLIHAMSEIGLVDRPGRTLQLYAAAAGNGGDHVRVRTDVVKIAETDSKGLELLAKALEDPAAPVREAAAVVLIRFRDALDAGQVITVDSLAQRASAEPEPGPRRRMLESIRVLAGAEAAKLSTAGLRAVVAAFGREGEDSRRVALEILASAVGRDALPAEVRDEVEELLAGTLNGQSSPAMRAAAVEAIANAPSPGGLDLLESWFLGPRATNGVFSRAGEVLLETRKGDAAKCWQLAGALANRETVPRPWSMAVAFGRQAIAAVVASEKHPLRETVGTMRDAVATWQGMTEDPEAWALALAHLDGRIASTPNAAALRVARAALHRRLSEGSEDVDEHRARAVEDLEFALSDAAVGLRPEQRARALADLAALRLQAGSARTAANALDTLEEVAGSLEDTTHYIRARSRVLDRRVDRGPCFADLDAISAEAAEKLGDRLLLTRAAAIVMDADVARHGEARNHLQKLTKADHPVAVELETLIKRSEACGEAFERAMTDKMTSGDRELLAKHADLCLLWAASSLEGESDEARGKSKLAILADIVGAQVLGQIAWPTDANGQAASVVTTELIKIWRARSPSQKNVVRFLKQG